MNALQTFIAGLPCGFITSAQMPELIALDRLCPVLARLGVGRFTCAAQDLAHLLKCVEAGGDYVRDVSLPVGSMERAAGWVPEGAGLVAHVPDPLYRAKQERNIQLNSVRQTWDESQCGGVFDGHGVVSDAEGGL